ncbi:hypothetical protein GCM10027360_42690 [Amycolatopsis echigonensis]
MATPVAGWVGHFYQAGKPTARFGFEPYPAPPLPSDALAPLLHIRPQAGRPPTRRATVATKP